VDVPSWNAIHLARLRGVSEGEILEFVRLEGLCVLDQSSVCLFFKWAMSGFRKIYKDSDMSESWTLHGGILLGHLDRYPTFPFVTFQWWYQGKNVLDASAGFLAVLAEEGMISSVAGIRCSQF
jgi:hypothetical protein